MHPSNITIGLTTFNRKNILLQVLGSLKNLDKSHDYLVCDDSSTEFDEEFLIKNFQGWRVYRSPNNSGRADFAISRLMDIFLETGKEYLLLLDSDLIIDPEITNFICKNASSTEGIFSVFNTPSHSTIKEEGEWLIKPHIGSAGAVFRRDILLDIRKNVLTSTKYDWDWSDYLYKKNIPIKVSKRSFVQHLGFSNGQNSNNFLMGDLGLNFYGYDKYNISLLLDEYLIQERIFLKEHLQFMINKIKLLDEKIEFQEKCIKELKLRTRCE